jgi:ribonuclease Z
MLMRLNLDKVTHPIHCYYPASGQRYFERLRYSCIYKENITVIEHPVKKAGIVENDGKFLIEAAFLDHGVENIGWRITEPDTVKFHKEELKKLGLDGPIIRKLEEEGKISWNDRWIHIDEVSHVRVGDTFAYVIDTRPCKEALELARGAKMLLCESTYLDVDREMANEYRHMTAKQAAMIAKEAGVQTLILTHFSARYRDQEVLAVEARATFPNTFAADDLKKFPFPK